MKQIQLYCPLSTPEEPLLAQLEAIPIHHLYSLEDPETDTRLIGGWIEPHLLPLSHPQIHTIEILDTTPINWEEQWQAFAPDFHDGKAHIDLSPHGTLLLKPGAGFGDLSHPTTRLALQLLAPRAPSTTLIDIGCGSGILSLASLILGARHAIGIDIDTDALAHAADNAALNNLHTQVTWTQELTTEQNLQEPLLIVMNMILSEQQTAWASQTQLHNLPATIITSGILASQKDAYLEMTQSWGWTLIEELREEEWMGFVYQT
jgi:ribosomal protein L11 methyltransferase